MPRLFGMTAKSSQEKEITKETTPPQGCVWDTPC
jgi:hypothetical protein